MDSGPDDTRGRHTPLWRRMLGIGRRSTWHDRHPLPDGWRPRTRIDAAGREVEPWGWMIADAHGSAYDGGEWWLPVGLDPDQAAHEVLEHWLAAGRTHLDPWELPGIRALARRAGYDGARVGVAYAAEQAVGA